MLSKFGSSYICTLKNLESSMCQQKRFLQPKLPSSAIEFDAFYLNRNISNLKTAIDDDQVAIIFWSSCMLNLIDNSLHIQFDGTFCVVHKMFLQLYLLMAIRSLLSMC